MGKVKKRFSTRQTWSQANSSLFTKECKCKDYDIYLGNKTVSQIYTVTSKDFSKTDLNWLIKNGKLTSRNKYVCNVCLDYAKDKCCKENDKFIEKDELATLNNEEYSKITEESIDKNKNERISKSVIDHLNNDNITEFECNELFEAMGNFLNMDVYSRSKWWITQSIRNLPKFHQ